MPGTVLSMQNIYLVKKNYANPPEGDTKPPEDSASMKFVYHQLNICLTNGQLERARLLRSRLSAAPATLENKITKNVCPPKS